MKDRSAAKCADTRTAAAKAMANTQRVPAKPFKLDETTKLQLKEEALRTLSRQECFERGFLTVKDLDDEELVAGRCRDAHSGVIPKRNKHTELIPAHLHDEMIAEHEARYRQRLRSYLNEALDTAVRIMNDDTAEPREQLEAAKWITERAAGKSVEHIQHTVEMKPWEGVMNDITGIGAISRAEHRRIQAEGGRAGIIDVEVVDEDDVPSQDVPVDGEDSAPQDVVSVHQTRPDEPVQRGTAEERLADLASWPPLGEEPVRFIDDERSFQHDPAAKAPDRPVVNVDTPDPLDQYGSKRTEAKGYADQVRDAEALAVRRKEAHDRRQNAKKQRKIRRATGADAIIDDITGATVTEDGQVTFE